jgi:4-hydroxy-tetrahydrodipicolinate synthase
MMTSFQDVVVPTVTLFHEDGAIDWGANADLIERLIRAGAHGIFVLGTTGEAQHLTPGEREETIRRAVEAVGRRVPLYVGVGDTCMAVTDRLLRASEEAGADAVVAVAPYFWKLQDRHLHAHFRAMAASTPLPLILYNYPDYVGVSLDTDLVRRLAAECPNIVGIKESLDSGTHMRRMAVHVKAVKEEFSVFCGHDDHALFALEAGLDGMVSSTANFAPELFVGLWTAYRNGDHAEAVRLSKAIGSLVEVYSMDACGAAVVKAALHLRGWIENSSPRPPALPLEEEQREFIRRRLKDLRLLDKAVMGDPR